MTCPCSCAVKDPFSLVAMVPDQGPYSEKMVFSMAVPFVAVSMALRMPSKPRVGILYVILHTNVRLQCYFQCATEKDAESSNLTDITSKSC